jgi:hypothetical protein
MLVRCFARKPAWALTLALDSCATWTAYYVHANNVYDITQNFFFNVSRRAAKFIDKKENGQETHTARFVGKPGET